MLLKAGDKGCDSPLCSLCQDMDVTKMRPASQYESLHSCGVRQRVSSGGSQGSEGLGSGTGGHSGRRKGNLSFDPNVNILMPEDITPKALRNVAERSGGKVYNAFTGTTCHQCRCVEGCSRLTGWGETGLFNED